VESSDCAFFFQAADGIRDYKVTGVQTCALPICRSHLLLNFGGLGFEALALRFSGFFLLLKRASDGFCSGHLRFGLLCASLQAREIGRASCRERVNVRGVAGSAFKPIMVARGP